MVQSDRDGNSISHDGAVAPRGIDRRTVVKTAAWAVPVLAVATAAPSATASGCTEPAGVLTLCGAATVGGWCPAEAYTTLPPIGISYPPYPDPSDFPGDPDGYAAAVVQWRYEVDLLTWDAAVSGPVAAQVVPAPAPQATITVAISSLVGTTLQLFGWDGGTAPVLEVDEEGFAVLPLGALVPLVSYQDYLAAGGGFGSTMGVGLTFTVVGADGCTVATGFIPLLALHGTTTPEI